MDLFVPGPEGKLEAVLWEPDQTARAAAIVCHPHPTFGGTMHNTVTYRVARGLRDAGLAALRFNFRGVGRSEGASEASSAEVEDAAAALAHLAAAYPETPLLAVGFSFGARTALGLAVRETRVSHVILVALPTKASDCAPLRELRQPGLILLAGEDEFGNRGDLLERFPDLPDELEVDEIPDADHFFRGRTTELEARVRAHAERFFA